MTELELFMEDYNKPESLQKRLKDTGWGDLHNTVYSEYFDTSSRYPVLKKFGFVIVNQELVDKIVKYSPILEVGVGLGYLAYECKKSGADYIATDLNPKSGNTYFPEDISRWTEVEGLSSRKALEKYLDRTLLMSWPCYGSDWAIKTLKRYTGTYFIYIGEGYSGCCGNDKFFRELDRNWTEIEDLGLKQFWGIHDRAIVYKRNIV